MSGPEAKCIVRSNSNTVKPGIRLRAATYLAPSIPVEFFDIVIDYLKNQLGYVDTSLRYESKCENLSSIFDNNEVDMGMTLTLPLRLTYNYCIPCFISPSNLLIGTFITCPEAWINGPNFVRLSSKQTVSLLPVASVHMHPKSDGRPGYFSDVIIHKALTSRFQSFDDLRGCKWAYLTEPSFSGNAMTLLHLKHLGENATFFGMTIGALSHLQCIYMVLNRQVDAAAVDSNSLKIFLERNPNFKEQIQVLTSLGPLPPYPIILNNNVSEELETEIVEALLKMHTYPKWAHKLNKYKVLKFVGIDKEEVIAKQEELMHSSKDMSFDVRYY